MCACIYTNHVVMRRFLGNFSLASYIIDEHIHTVIRAGVKITVIVQYAKEGCSMSRDMLKPMQDDTGHPKKKRDLNYTIPPRPAKR